jgi:FtsH-binding integral membrane protein
MLELSPDLQALLFAGVTFLVTEGLKALGPFLKIDISGAKSVVVAALVGVLLLLVNGWLALIPPEYHEVARSVMSLVVVVLSSFGVHKTVKRFG